MNRGMKRFFLLFYFMAVTAGFAYYLFPSKAVVDLVTVRAKRAFPEMTVAIRDARPSFPPGVSLKGIEIRYGALPVTDIEKMNVSLTLGSLFTQRKVVRVSARLLGGKLEADITHMKGQVGDAPAVGSNASRWVLTGIELGRLEALKQATGLEMSGSLSGTFSGGGPTSGPEITGEIAISDYRAAFSSAMFGIEALEWKEVKAEFDWMGRRLNLKKCEAAGPQTEVTIAGKGEWKQPFRQSVLGFEGTVKPGAEFMAALTKTVPAALLPKKAAGKDGIPIKLKGTIGSPDLSFR